MITILRTPALRRPLLLLLGSIALGTLLFDFSLTSRLASEQALIRQAARAVEAEDDALRAPERLASDAAAPALYREIARSGFDSPENRVGWVSALSRVQTQLELDSLSWRLGPRTASPLASGLGYTAMDISASAMNSERLDAMLKLLREIAPGRFTLEYCMLAMNPDGVVGQANCRLNWWTLQSEGAAAP